MTRMTITISSQTTGAADDAEIASYIANLQIALALEYPDADISIARNDRLSSNAVECGDIDRSEIDSTMNRVWELM